jgi:hypothetical protein
MRNVPPAEIKGRGKPLTGISPTVIAVLTNTCANKIVPMPIKIRLENRSLDRKEFFIILLNKYP